LTGSAEAAVAKINRWGVFGVFPNHAWDVSGPQNISTTTIQPFLVFLPGGGWTSGIAGILKYDWEGKQWTVPLNLGVSRTVKPDKTPWKYSRVRPEHAERG
jgi:hypothetical protein